MANIKPKEQSKENTSKVTKCSDCHGSGWNDGNTDDCSTCIGTGVKE